MEAIRVLREGLLCRDERPPSDASRRLTRLLEPSEPDREAVEHPPLAEVQLVLRQELVPCADGLAAGFG